MFILEFFRDTLSGFVYFIYLAVCIFALFYLMGLVADRKRKAINEKLKQKKKYDIESGREAAIAAMETKQILDVQEEDKNNANSQNLVIGSPTDDANLATQKEKIPDVMVFDSTDTTNNNQVNVNGENKTETDTEEPKVQGPITIDSSSIKIDSSSIKIDSSSIKQ